MNGAAVPAVSWEEAGLIRTLAIVGAAVLSGLVLGLVAQLLVRSLTTKKLPPWPLRILRALGAIAGGWVVALWLFGGGGSGIGGPGGLGLGPGSGFGEGKKKLPELNKDAAPKKAPSEPEAPAGEAVRVEVLGAAPLKKIAGGGQFDPERCYRVETKDGTRLWNLSEVEAYLKQRVQADPNLRRISVVLYKDSPAQGVAYVEELAAWAREEKLKVDFYSPDNDAPIR